MVVRVRLVPAPAPGPLAPFDRRVSAAAGRRPLSDRARPDQSTRAGTTHAVSARGGLMRALGRHCASRFASHRVVRRREVSPLVSFLLKLLSLATAVSVCICDK